MDQFHLPSDHLDVLTHNGETLSYVQPYGSDGVVVIDRDAILREPFTYKRYCQKQNEWMRLYGRVYRFLESDQNLADFRSAGCLPDSDLYGLSRTMDRESTLAEPTPLEYRFEECFIDAFGEEALKYLKREYAFLTDQGNTVYVDYALFRKDGTWIAIEENGIRYHHPQIIGKERYQHILKKQNAIVAAYGIVFRWDTESLFHREKIADELREFLGDLDDYLIQYSLSASRGFSLHEHQADQLSQLQADRDAGKRSALVVLPTGTGKTVIALEDMVRVAAAHGSLDVLILVPSLDLVLQWQKAAAAFETLIGRIQVQTYAAIARQYHREPVNQYHYIVVDEAHHGPAPILKKVIQHYQPLFLLGLTATDKRLDERRLESVFGSYEEKLDLKEAIQKGLLCQIRAFRLESTLDLSEVRFNGRDYVSSDLEKRIRVNSRNELIADVLHTYFYSRLPGKSGLVYCVNVAHAKEMAKILRLRGFTAESVDGSDPRRYDKIRRYMERQIQFLCTCSLLTEGWDAPHTSVIVMARPTLSRVLYAQQLGRGTRKTEGKEALYVIDVVDRYGSFGQLSNRPWSVNSLLNQPWYVPFGDLVPRSDVAGQELVILGTTHEQPVKLQPYELFTMQRLYESYLSVESLARELFVSTGTVRSWINTGELTPDVHLPMGRSAVDLFHPDQIAIIRLAKGLKEHTEATIVEDFWEFLAERSYSYSYKMVFLLALLKQADSTGDAEITGVLSAYREFYLNRIRENKTVDRPGSPYHDPEFLMDDKALTNSLLSNPFEKFERKRFFYYAKDLKKISIHHRLWEDLTHRGGLEKLRRQMQEDLIHYYAPLGGY